MRVLLPALLALLGLAGCGGASTPLTVVNRSTTPVEQMVVSGSGFEQSLGSIAPGATATSELNAKGETGLAVSFSVGTQRVSLPPQGYFEGGGGYAVTVVINPDLEVSVDASLRSY